MNNILKPKSKEEINQIYKDLQKKGSINKYNEIIGKTIKTIINECDEIIFRFDDNIEYKMFHIQDCCEYVTLEDINGELNDLIDSPLLIAEEIICINEHASESGTWTFYKFATIKGYVTIRWYGTSNGYYSENVNFIKMIL